MFLLAGCLRADARALGFVAFLSAAVLSGCGGAVPTEEQSVGEFFKNSPEAKRLPVAKVAGRVTVDGQAPSGESRIFVVLSDPQKLVKLGERPPQYYAMCDAEGKFAFTTYVTGDGVPYGKYVVAFAALHRPKNAKGRPFGLRRGIGGAKYEGPDELKNLYNDPEKNLSEPKFTIDAQDAGRADYDFDLSVAGKDPIVSPGPYALTRLIGGL